MTPEESIRLVFSFLGGGLVAGILNWIRTNRAERVNRRIRSLEDQIQRLYAPLHFLVAQNKCLLELNRKFHEAYEAEFVGKNWSQEPVTQKTLREKTSTTLRLANALIDLLKSGNDRILKVLRDNLAYMDIDDEQVFRAFMTDYIRQKTEIDDQGRVSTPFEIYERIGAISFIRPEFIDRIAQKFRAKQDQLRLLTK